MTKYVEFKDTFGATVRVRDAEQMTTPSAWLFVEHGEGNTGSAVCLDKDHARHLISGLRKFTGEDEGFGIRLTSEQARELYNTIKEHMYSDDSKEDMLIIMEPDQLIREGELYEGDDGKPTFFRMKDGD